jgi:hypothetical protein
MMKKIMNANLDKKTAHQEEKKPTSSDRKPEAAEQQEVPVEDTEVMPVGEPKKKSCRDRKLAAECRCQKPKVFTRENYETQKKLAIARRETSHRATVAQQKDKRSDNRMPRCATVARRKRHIINSYLPLEKCHPRRELVTSRTRTTHHAGVA